MQQRAALKQTIITDTEFLGTFTLPAWPPEAEEIDV